MLYILIFMGTTKMLVPVTTCRCSTCHYGSNCGRQTTIGQYARACALAGHSVGAIIASFGCIVGRDTESVIRATCEQVALERPAA